MSLINKLISRFINHDQNEFMDMDVHGVSPSQASIIHELTEGD